MRFATTAQDGTSFQYNDAKRWLWLVGGAWTFGVPYVAAAIFFATGGALWTVFLLPLHIFVIVPVIDYFVGEDRDNPPEPIAEVMTADPFYMRMIHILVLLGYASVIGGMWFVMSQNLPVWAGVITIAILGLHNGTLITLAHELGHKTNKLDRFFAKLSLGAVGYGHFMVEHNLGHHKNVSTPEDCASARMGESVYAFATRELPGAFLGAWRIEGERLKKRGHKLFSRHNEILQSNAITLVFAGGLIAWLGPQVLPWFILHGALAYWGLTSVNYIEHYGLLRQKMPNGRYELCAPRHSWNTDHTFSNIMQVQLQRHSDHHANPMRPYQVLRSFDDVPRLPSGYPGCIALAAIPPLWFRVMDPRVMKWADGDLAKANIHGPARPRLEQRWGGAPGANA